MPKDFKLFVYSKKQKKYISCPKSMGSKCRSLLEMISFVEKELSLSHPNSTFKIVHYYTLEDKVYIKHGEILNPYGTLTLEKTT